MEMLGGLVKKGEKVPFKKLPQSETGKVLTVGKKINILPPNTCINNTGHKVLTTQKPCHLPRLKPNCGTI